MRARRRAAMREPQRADPEIEQSNHDRRGHRHEQHEALARLGPRQLPDVVPEVLAEHRIGDPEVRRCRCQGGQPPPVSRSPREPDSEEQPAPQSQGEQHALRHGLHNLEVTEAARHLHRADRAIDEVDVNGAPRHREDQDGKPHDARERASVEVDASRRNARGPRPLGGLQRQPAPAHEQDDQHCDGSDQAPASPGRGHTGGGEGEWEGEREGGGAVFAASQPSTSAR